MAPCRKKIKRGSDYPTKLPTRLGEGDCAGGGDIQRPGALGHRYSDPSIRCGMDFFRDARALPSQKEGVIWRETEIPEALGSFGGQENKARRLALEAFLESSPARMGERRRQQPIVHRHPANLARIKREST